MSKANDPAYPFPVMHGRGSPCGLTKREVAAIAAMQSLLESGRDSDMRGHEGWREEFSREAIRFADALLAELAKEPQP